MWTLTICLLALLGLFGAVLVVVVRNLALVATKQSEHAAEVLVAVVERLIKPLVDPDPIRQIDVPGQTEMFNEPDWSKTWEEASGTG